MAITWKKLDSFEQLTDIKNQWADLNTQANDGCFFTSPTWLLNWSDTFWNKHWQLYCFAVYDQEMLIAFLPFYFQRNKFIFRTKNLFLLGQGENEKGEIASEYLDILIDDRYLTEVISQCHSHISPQNFDTFFARAINKRSNLLKIFPMQNHSLCGYKYIVDAKKWQPSLLSNNTKSRIKRSKNQLNNLEAQFFWVTNNEKTFFWNEMAKLHQKRWLNKGCDGAFSQEKFHNFHAHLINQQKNVMMSALKVNGKIIAINYYLVDKNNMYFYQSGWNEDNFKSLSPGFTLHVWSIENTDKDKYDFMMGNINDSYKSKFNCPQVELFQIFVKYRPVKGLIIKFFQKIFSN